MGGKRRPHKGSTLSWDLNNKKPAVWTSRGRKYQAQGKNHTGPKRMNLVGSRNRRKDSLTAKSKWLLSFLLIWLFCSILYHPLVSIYHTFGSSPVPVAPSGFFTEVACSMHSFWLSLTISPLNSRHSSHYALNSQRSEIFTSVSIPTV